MPSGVRPAIPELHHVQRRSPPLSRHLQIPEGFAALPKEDVVVPDCVGCLESGTQRQLPLENR
jgi:hypothetical protein